MLSQQPRLEGCFSSFSGFWLNESLLALAERVVKLSPPDFTMCQFCNSGSEASETAVKIAHQYHIERGKRSAQQALVSLSLEYFSSPLFV